MARGEKAGYYEIVLEQRHLLGVFFAVVLLCAVFFTLGFVLGRDRAHASLAAKTSASPDKAEQKAGQAAAPGDLTFYDRVEGKQPKETLPPKPKPKATSLATKTATTLRKPATKPPAAPTKPIYLQVGAFAEEVQARSLGQRLLKLGFPVVIQAPSKDRLHRVRVGPFESAELADAAQKRLEAQGFRQILRR